MGVFLFIKNKGGFNEVEYYSMKEKQAYEILLSFGIHEPIAKDCIASRNANEIEIIMEFLSRYGGYINKTK